MLTQYMRPHGQTQNLVGQALGDGKSSPSPAASPIGLLKMRRDRIVDQCARARLAQRLLQGVATWMPDDVKMPDWLRPIGNVRHSHVCGGELLLVTICDGAAARVPFIEMDEFYAQDRRLQRVEATVETPLFVHIFFPRAVIAQ